MRSYLVALGLAALASGAGVGSAQALPGTSKPQEFLPGPVKEVRLVCDPQRCYDPQTGAYGESGCNARGCYPIGPAIGRLGSPGSAYGPGRNVRGYDDDDYEEPRPRRRGYGQEYGRGYGYGGPQPNIQIVPSR